MNMESKYTPLVALTLSAALLTGCTAETAPTPPDTTSQKSDLLFEAEPEGDFSVSNCERNPNSWAVSIDDDPTDTDRDATVGITETYNEKGRPNSVSGAKYRSLGNLAYEIVTSEDQPGDTTIINLGNESFAKNLEGGDGYDVVLTARLGSDGKAYFGANCLPEFDFPSDKDLEAPLVPLQPEEPPVEFA